MPSILDYIPDGITLRPNQEVALLNVEDHWNKAEVLVLLEDVGAGKSVILKIIADWQAAMDKKTAIITPQVMLQDQYALSFEDLTVVKGAGRYSCKESPGNSCRVIKDCLKTYCKGCPYKAARIEAAAASTAVYNVHSYILFRQNRGALLIDEAHKLLEILTEAYTIKLWCKKYGAPSDIKNFGVLISWLETTLKTMDAEAVTLGATVEDYQADDRDLKEYEEIITAYHKLTKDVDKLTTVLREIKVAKGKFFVEQAEEYYYGKPEQVIKLRPKSLEGLSPKLWSNQYPVKIILASGTINKLDIKKLGLGDRKVVFFDGGSPLEAVDRPIKPEFVGNMGYKYQDKNLPLLATKIRELQERHSGTKGIVHMPYNMAHKLRKHLRGINILWHTKEDKAAQLDKFKAAPPGTVIIASGMSMGVDLPGPDFGWGAVAKIMYPSMADGLIKELYTTDKAWIGWLTARELVQACGRINRYVGDKGTMYILDSAFGTAGPRKGLYQDANRRKYLPNHFKERIVW